MILKDVPPSPSLSDFVCKHQIIRFEFGPEAILPIKAYWPRPEQYIIFYFRDRMNISNLHSFDQITHPKCTIGGQYTALMNKHVSRDFWCLQIVLIPGALFRLTGIPCYELTNTFIDAEAIWNPEIRDIHEQIVNCNNIEQSILIAESFLEKIIRRSKQNILGIDKVGKIILCQELPQSMDYFASQSCLSVRQFHRKFTERNGISPKSFDRISRLNRAIRLKNRNPNNDWLSIAIACGYYDYQHLARDFQEFTSHSPNAFYEIDTKAPERAFGEKEV